MPIAGHAPLAASGDEGPLEDMCMLGLRTHVSHMSASTCSLDSSGSCMHGSGTLSDPESSSVGYGLYGEEPPFMMHTTGAAAIPDCFRCPISQQVMEDPVVLEDGRTYDRSSVPSTGQEGEPRPNVELKEAMEGFFELLEATDRRQHDWLQQAAHQEQKISRKLLQRKKQVHALRDALEHSRRRCEEFTSTASSDFGGAPPFFCNSDDSMANADVAACTPERPRSQRFRAGPAPRSSEAAAGAGAAAAAAGAVARRLVRTSAWTRLLPGCLPSAGGDEALQGMLAAFSVCGVVRDLKAARGRPPFSYEFGEVADAPLGGRDAPLCDVRPEYRR
eukprot:CAMPEP_0176101004 /NCGR_PEP_ID=MMETSP0120_2-20121206/50662_1 /TAXON_ID=160619 /ORGANISM="Kryptoperidinium foliaceum, Strain CCMP 1326" /LENGTH=332 /DNA_ID=CAMNT_0017435057 /DNA_START=82 /DNA_END=1078 /DNA_ORIENTATION=+